jgi:hypothetical protein
VRGSSELPNASPSLASALCRQNCLALRLAIFYDAPLDDLESIVTAGKEAAPGAIGLIYGTRQVSHLLCVGSLDNGSLESPRLLVCHLADSVLILES